MKHSLQFLRMVHQDNHSISSSFWPRATSNGCENNFREYGSQVRGLHETIKRVL
jgi:hypothetical protein